MPTAQVGLFPPTLSEGENVGSPLRTGRAREKPECTQSKTSPQMAKGHESLVVKPGSGAESSQWEARGATEQRFPAYKALSDPSSHPTLTTSLGGQRGCDYHPHFTEERTKVQGEKGWDRGCAWQPAVPTPGGPSTSSSHGCQPLPPATVPMSTSASPPGSDDLFSAIRKTGLK